MVVGPGGLGPVQLIVIAFAGDAPEDAILEQLHRLRGQEAVRLVDLLILAKDESGDIVELESGDLSESRPEPSGAAIRSLIGLGGEGAEPVRAARDPAVSAPRRYGSQPEQEDLWYLADAIPTGAAAAVALVEHRWAIPLRDAIEAGAENDPLDAWVHPEDLVAIAKEL